MFLGAIQAFGRVVFEILGKYFFVFNAGLLFFVELLTATLKLSNEDYFPKWYDGSEFKAARK